MTSCSLIVFFYVVSSAFVPLVRIFGLRVIASKHSSVKMELQSTSRISSMPKLKLVADPSYIFQTLLDFKLFENRVRTFTDKWRNKFFTPYQMAAAGFYHLTNDKVKCVYCLKKLRNLAEGDDIEQKHRVLSPRCKFDQKPFGLHLYRMYNKTTSAFKSCMIFIAQEGVRQTGIISNPRYSSYENRLSTVNNWRENMTTDTHIINICKAGFFYTGYADNFQCFGCDFLIKYDPQLDDARFLHSTCKPWCRLLILSKGKLLIKKIGIPLVTDGSISEVQTPHRFITSMEYKRINYTFIANDEKKLRFDSLAKQPRPRHCSIPDLENQLATVDPSLVDDRMLCKICRLAMLEVAFLPCGHLHACVDCSVGVYQECSVCREPNAFAMRLFVYNAFNVIEDAAGQITYWTYEDSSACRMCGDCEMEVALVPCKHVFSCFACAADLTRCPLCDVDVIAYVRVYLP